MIKQIFIKNAAVTSMKQLIRVREAAERLAQESATALGFLPHDSQACAVLEGFVSMTDIALEAAPWDVNAGSREGN